MQHPFSLTLSSWDRSAWATFGGSYAPGWEKELTYTSLSEISSNGEGYASGRSVTLSTNPADNSLSTCSTNVGKPDKNTSRAVSHIPGCQVEVWSGTFPEKHYYRPQSHWGINIGWSWQQFMPTIHRSLKPLLKSHPPHIHVRHCSYVTSFTRTSPKLLLQAANTAWCEKAWVWG